MHCRGFSPKLGYFARFSINIIDIAGRISETSMGGAGARGAPYCLLMSLKRWVRAVHGRARAAKKILLLKVHKHEFFFDFFCRNPNLMVPRACNTKFLKIVFDSAEIFDF